MSLADVVDLLVCPVCRAPLALDGASLACEARHRFDVARQGHVNLLAGPQPANADTPAMVAARLEFLSRGHYGAIADALDEAVGPAGTILDAGAGPGWYAARLLDGRPGARALALDVSAAACRRAARAHPRLGAVVADTWRPLPVRTGSVDVVTCVFAPRNADEFRRVLNSQGRLVVAAPGPDHLAEAREALGLLAVDPTKDERLHEALAEPFAPGAVRTVRTTLRLAADELAAVVDMGPNAHHEHGPATGPMDVTLDVRVSTWLRRA